MKTGIEPKKRITVARFKCPSCQQQIETHSGADSLSLQCPSCQAEFVPKHFSPEYEVVDAEMPVTEKVKPAPVETNWKITVEKNNRKRRAVVDIEGSAEVFSLFSRLCLYGFLIGLVVLLFPDAQTWTVAAVLSTLLALFLMFQIIAQLMFIRAKLTEK